MVSRLQSNSAFEADEPAFDNEGVAFKASRYKGCIFTMPIYEYYCDQCKKVSSFLLLRVSEEIEPYCKSCKTKAVRRILSRVAVLKSEESRMESLLDPSKLSDLDEKDPRSVEKVMRRMGRELGDELGEGFEQEMEEALSESESSPQEDL